MTDHYYRREDSEENMSFLGSEFSSSAKDSLFHVLPAPLENSVSYGTGTAGGPDAIIRASMQLEKWDGFSIPGNSGIFTVPVDYSKAFQTASGAGSDRPETVMPAAEHPAVISDNAYSDRRGEKKAGETQTFNTEAFLEILTRETLSVFSEKKIPVILGGEHIVSLAAFRAIKADPLLSEKTAVLQFDAHADLRDSYEGSTLSHACVMRRAFDLGIPFYQVGVRSLSPEEVIFRSDNRIYHLDAHEAVKKGIDSIALPASFPEYLYITIDVDGLDPSVISATGTPEPGGLGWYQILSMIESAASQRKIKGFDVTELAPTGVPGMHAPDFAAARLAYNVMGIISRSFRREFFK